MVIFTFLQICTPLLLLAQVNGVLPPKKRPYVPNVGQETSISGHSEATHDSGVRLDNTNTQDSTQYSTSTSTNGIAHERSSSTSLEGPMKKKHQWTSEITKERSIIPLRASSASKRDNALQQHHLVAQRLEGQDYKALSADEKTQLAKTRAYFNTRASKERNQGNYEAERELLNKAANLPSPYYSRRLPNAPITPEIEKKMAHAEKTRKYRERLKADAFMEREFGKPRPVLRRGRKLRDPATISKTYAKKLQARRAYYYRQKGVEAPQTQAP